jgi:hypothetical protein
MSTTIHDALPLIVSYPPGWVARSHCSCGWTSDRCENAYRTKAEDMARQSLRHHQESQLQPTKGATDEIR